MQDNQNDHQYTANLNGCSCTGKPEAITQSEDVGADSRWEEHGTRWILDERNQHSLVTPSVVSDPRKAPRNSPHCSLGCKPCCGSIQKVRRAGGKRGSLKQSNGSWPGGTYMRKNRVRCATHPRCTVLKEKWRLGWSNKAAVEESTTKRQTA